MLVLMQTRADQLERTYTGLVETNHLLVQSFNGRLSPAGVSDDIGLYLFAPPLARALGINPVDAASWLLIAMLVVGACVGILGWLLTLKTNPARLASVAAYAVLGALGLKFGDVYVASVAAVLAVVPWTLWLWSRPPRVATTVAIAAPLGIWIGQSNLVRAHSGTTVLVFLVVGTLLLRGARPNWKAAMIAAVLGGLLLTTAASYGVVQSRNAFLSQREDVLIVERAGHPFWHTVYIGLGYLSNQHGITYLDENAIEKVRERDRDIVYLSEEYEATLRQEVVSLALRDPRFVLSTVFAKAGVLEGIFLLLAGWAVRPALRRRKPHWVDLAFFASMFFAALPAIVAVPHIEYITGYIAVVLLWTVATADDWMLGRMPRKSAHG